MTLSPELLVNCFLLMLVIILICCRVGDVPDLTADPALAEKELGFKAPRVLEEMCRDQWNWQSCVFFSLSLTLFALQQAENSRG